MNFADYFNPYAYAIQLRRMLYRQNALSSTRIGIPVISIGNLTVGGTGKTPLTLLIANHCNKVLNKEVGVVLRGYKRKTSGLLVVSDGRRILEDVNASGDEAQLYTQELPNSIVVCDEDRIRGAKKAQELGAEIILLDDGFQHQRLKRDLNIVVIDASKPIPNVLPFGKGRESQSALRDADIVVLTNKTDASPQLIDFQKTTIAANQQIDSIQVYSGGTTIELLPTELKEKKVLILSGIGNPLHFEKSVQYYSPESVPYRLVDHVHYDFALLEKIYEFANANHCELILTTTKDAVKLLVLVKINTSTKKLLPIGVVHSSIHLADPEGQLFSRIKTLFRK
ncbi:MAG: tetraacyldisaccharide 4'-kinase [bacterium]